MKKIFIITGELSGEIHAANLVKALKKKDKNLKFYAVGSELLKKNGCEIVEDYKHISIIGFSEVISKYFIIKKVFKKIYDFIDTQKPDLIITVDFPGFNLRVAKYAHKKNIKLIYFIPPQIWAWHYSRIKLIKKYFSLVIPALPFEKDIYEKEGIPVKYFGHPILENINFNKNKKEFMSKYRIPDNKKIIAVLPGSRKQELTANVDVIFDSMKLLNRKFRDIFFVIPTGKRIDYFKKFTEIPNVKIIKNHNYDILNIASAGIIKSGTSTLEAAVFKLPMTVVYKVSRLSFILAKYFILKIKFVSLVNLIADKEVVKELLQDDFTPENIFKEISRILTDTIYRKKMVKELTSVKKNLGKLPIMSKIAAAVLKILN